MEKGYINILNDSIKLLFKRALGIATRYPKQFCFLLKTVGKQKKATKLRLKWEEEGVHVPPFMIFSITNKCNLKCAGCYARVHNEKKENDLKDDKITGILTEAKELGISIILLAGGEPLSKKNILDITARFPDIIFPLFTNGTLIDDKIAKTLSKQKNTIPIISIEGNRDITDKRRGKGIYDNVRSVFEKLRKNNVIFGVSITLTKENFSAVKNEEYLKDIIKQGCSVFLFVEYVPVEEGTENLVIDNNERLQLKEFIDFMLKKYNPLFISFPGDEEQFGGCLAAGRGFIHINPSGDVEPCPFSPFSDSNLNNLSLKDALKSKLLEDIKQNHNELQETSSGCALFDKKDWVSSLLSDNKK